MQLAPNFPDAIEYRGEAYLALNRLDDAKQSYLTLFAMDRKQADSLMTAMKDYVAKKKADPAGVDAAALSAFESWINERAGVAEQTKLMAFNAHHGSWRYIDGTLLTRIDDGTRIRSTANPRDADHADSRSQLTGRGSRGSSC